MTLRDVLDPCAVNRAGEAFYTLEAAVVTAAWRARQLDRTQEVVAIRRTHRGRTFDMWEVREVMACSSTS